MSGLDLHPEDLLDRHVSGSLSDAERAILDAHLARCSACRFDLAARKDFASELGSEVPMHDGALVTLAIERATSNRPPAQREAPSEPVRIAPRRRNARRAASLVLVAASFLLATASFAAVQSGALSTILRATGLAPAVVAPSTPPAESSPSKLPPMAPRTTNVMSSHEEPAAIATAPIETLAPEPNAPPITPETPAPPPPPVAVVRPVLVAPQPIAPASSQIGAPSAAPPPRHEEARRDAASIFADASLARRSGDHASASKLYRELLERFAGAPEAASARVALGRLLLDEGDPASALPLFQQYVASDERALREEALVGRARALGKLGRDADERRAWATVLESYPQSIHAERARARLAELGNR